MGDLHQREPRPQTIAICGIGLRLPGGIRTCHDYWDLLSSGRDAKGPMPATRQQQDSGNAEEGYFLDEELGALDTSFFTLTKGELAGTDPQQLILLEVVRECLDDAAEVHHRGRLVGCYVGTFGDDWVLMGNEIGGNSDSDGHVGAALGDLMLANRVSYEYDLCGPSMALKTGCSASLVALHEACRAIQTGDAMAAVVAGTSLIMTGAMTATMETTGVLSPDGSCKTFDAAADGYARAEAVSAIYIKRLDDAIRDGNPIRALIRSTVTNSDGKGGDGGSLAMPNGAAHEVLMRKAYHDADLDPRDTVYVECHGTGTPTGDPIETHAVGRVFGGPTSSGIYIGSVKPNVGHSEGASGISSIIKAVLALEHKTIPPNIKFVNPNPRINFEGYKIKVPVVPMPFPRDRAERISVNSFGVGGTNAHVILESYRPLTSATSTIATRDSELLLFSANTETSLTEQVARYQDHFRHRDHAKHVDVAYTLAMNREHLPYKSFSVVSLSGDLLQDLTPRISTQSPAIVPPTVMIFSGQGAQWPLMGRELVLHDPDFATSLAEMDEILQSLKHPPDWNLSQELLRPAETSQIHKAELAQPLCTALQVALVKRYAALGVSPDFVVGHSSGEIAAAFGAGLISMREAIIIAYYRGYVVKRAQSMGGEKSDGGMAAIGLGADELKGYLLGFEGKVVVACENSPTSSTISGDRDKVMEVVAAIKRDMPETFARQLVVDTAYHSHHMSALSQEYESLLDSEQWIDGRVETTHPTKSASFFSSVTGERVTNDAGNTGISLGPSYWARNLTSPVLFSSAMFNLIGSSTTNATTSTGSDKFTVLEIGPHSTLAGPLRQIWHATEGASSNSSYTYIPSLTRNNDSRNSFLSSVGQLYQAGMRLNLQSLFPSTLGAKPIPNLPSYPWDHSIFRVHDAFLRRQDTKKGQYPSHFLLGTRIAESSDLEPQWRNSLSLQALPWVADHKIQTDVVFPFAGYITIAGEAVRQATKTQIGTGGAVGYRLRHVIAHAAMLLPQDTRSEDGMRGSGRQMVTSLRKHKLNDDQDSSEWFEFSITSCAEGSSSWTRHCHGKVALLAKETTRRGAADSQTSKWELDDLPRRVDCARMYEALAKVGYVFGPTFRGLTAVTTSTTEELALGRIRPAWADSGERGEPELPHPTAIDACLQLLVVAAKSRGLIGRQGNTLQLAVPSLIDQIEIHTVDCSEVVETHLYAKAWNESTTADQSTIECQKGNKLPVVRITGVHLRAIADTDDHFDVSSTDSNSSNWYNDIHAAARLNWMPDFDFLNPSALFRPPPPGNKEEMRLEEELAFLCIVESARRVRGLTPCKPHFAKFRVWLDSQVTFQSQDIHLSDLVGAEARARLANLSSEECTTTINHHINHLANSTRASTTKAIKLVFENIADIFTGTTDTIAVLFPDQVLARIYDSIKFTYTTFIRLLAHSRPQMRILEVGAGTGGTTEVILRSLSPHADDDTMILPRYGCYTFTDLSAGFFPAARDRFARYDTQNLEYKVFDVSVHPSEQGFPLDDESLKYDLIIASNVIHATPNLQIALANLNALLKSDGMLVMTEVMDTQTIHRGHGYVFGTFSGWWLGEPDGRVDRPYVSLERWDVELRGAGFSGVDGVVFDDEDEEYTRLAVILSRKAALIPVTTPNKEVALLASMPETGVARELAVFLTGQGWSVTCFGLTDVDSGHVNLNVPSTDIISILDLESPNSGFFESITPATFSAFQLLLETLSPVQNLLWVMPPCQMACTDPHAAQTLGVLQTARSELALRLSTLEIDAEAEPGFCELVMRVFDKVRFTAAGEQSELTGAGSVGGHLETDKEFCVRDGVVYVGRYWPFSLAREVAGGNTDSTAGVGPSEHAAVLDMGEPGRLDTLQWCVVPLPTTLGLGQVEISVSSAGLNFRDVAYATGLLTSDLGARVPLGMEVSGTISRIGHASKFKVGDHVMAFADGGGGFTTKMIIPSDGLVLRLPTELSHWTHQQVATIQGVSVTAVYALLDIGQLRSGMSVLVHSACGGVGLAAMQVCRMVGGVRVYCTVGGSTAGDKIKYLEDNFGISRGDVFSSRSADEFYRGVMKATGGEGVDLVLNSLSGELLHSSWRCVARGGKMLELGKRDLKGFASLDMSRFLDNRSYCGVDVAYLAKHRPEMVKDVLRRTLEFCKQGLLSPLEPITEFDAVDVKHAFRHLQAGTHMGKAVLNMPGGYQEKVIASLNPVSQARSVRFRLDGAYLLVGGVGGLGRSLATWLVERGARQLIFLSQTAGVSNASRHLANELASMGCTTRMVTGSVTSMDDVNRAISAASDLATPIRGVFQLAMAQRDAPLIKMSWSDWKAANEPKVTGTWNLHKAFLQAPLDIFWLASSIVTVIDQPGQANYKAACTFLESFGQYRHSLNLPASVLSICPIDDVGFVADNASVRRNLRVMGLYSLGEREFLDAVEASLLGQQSSGSHPPRAELNTSEATGWQSTGHIIMGLRSTSQLPLDDPRNPTNWRRDRRMGLYHNISPPTIGSSQIDTTSSNHPSSLKAFIARLADSYRRNGEDSDDSQTSAEFLAVATARKVHEFLLRAEDVPVDTALSLTQIGLDSLTAIELRRWFRQAMGLQVTVLEIMDSSSLMELGRMLVGRLREKFGSSGVV